MNPIIRTEKVSEFAEISQLIQQAFMTAEHSDGTESQLVERLRISPAFIPQLSLVALVDKKVAGYILFTKVQIGTQTQLGLAPLAVLPEFQRQGIGSSLVQKGHQIAADMGYGWSVVLGSDRYYPRFGYCPAAQYGILCPFPGVAPQNYMAIRLRDDAPDCYGVVKYSPEFG